MTKAIIEALKQGKVCAIPTDTVYGLVVDATNAKAVEKLYLLKGRDANKPSQILVNSLTMIRKLAKCDRRAETLMQQFFPGALTLIMPSKLPSIIVPQALAHGQTIGIRQPASKLINEIIDSLGLPLAASSVNPQGEPPLNDAKAIAAKFPEITIHEGKIISPNVSSVLELTAEGFTLHRAGVISREEIEESLNYE